GSLMDDNRYWVLTPDPQPAFDVHGLKSGIPDYHAITKGSVTVKGTFKNIGTTTLTSCDVNYSIDGGATVTAPATINLASNGETVISSPTVWTPTVAATYSVAMWLSNLNGNTDEDLNNDVATKSIQVSDDYVVRMPLHEVFTSSTCGPCVAGNKNTDENIFPNYPGQFTVIKYQMSWPSTGDPYYTTEGNVRRGLYGVNSIPNMQVDGGWNLNAGSYTTTLFDQFKSKPAFIKIDATHTINFKKVSVNVKLTPLADYNNANMKVFVVVLEKKTTKNVKTNGETEFFHVMKKMLPDANGTALGNVTKNVEKTFTTMNYNIPGNYRLPADAQAANTINLNTENSIEELNDCEVVVFVQDIVTKEVFQSANSVGTILSIDDVNGGDNSMSIYPNPSNTGSTNVSFQLNNPEGVTVKVYNTMGQLVYEVPVSEITAGANNLTIDSSNFASGIYTVKIEGNGFSAAQKFIVQ
ncbi:MAG TPA: T9SS type A sorting domain-containing protein, partial [Bacteroidia bacterium]